MARIRTTKPEFWTSEQIVECSPVARLLFIGLWNFCDDGGVHPASLKQLKMQVFPGDDFTTDDIQKFVAELISNELLTEFTSSEKSYWWVTGWHHQKIDRPTFKYPQPGKEKSNNDTRSLDDDSTNNRRELGEPLPPEGMGKGKDEDEDVKDVRKKFTPPSLDEVREYVKFNHLDVDSERFIDFYTAKAWMIGKNGMKDWQAAARNWGRRNKTAASNANAPAPLMVN